MKNPSKVTLAHRVCAMQNDDPEKEEKLTTCLQVLNYLIAIYATDDGIAKREAEITNFKKPEYISAVRYSEVSLEKGLRCGHVHDKARLYGVFIKGLHDLVRFSLRIY